MTIYLRHFCLAFVGLDDQERVLKSLSRLALDHDCLGSIHHEKNGKLEASPP